MLKLDKVEPPADRSQLWRVVSFTRPYVFTLLSTVVLLALGWTTRRGRATIVELSRRLGYSHDRREPLELPVVATESLSGGCSEVRICALDAVDGNVTEKELVIVARLVHHHTATEIFEFGTFDGRTTLNLAANAPEGGTVHTIDLPRGASGSLAVPILRTETQYADKAVSGSRFRGTAQESLIEQHYGDTGTFDFSSFYDRFDFIFVDASHAYPYVISDSLNALSMLRSSGGTIVWHDYGYWDGVTRALNDLRRYHPDFAQLALVAGTSLAILRKQ